MCSNNIVIIDTSMTGYGCRVPAQLNTWWVSFTLTERYSLMYSIYWASRPDWAHPSSGQTIWVINMDWMLTLNWEVLCPARTCYHYTGCIYCSAWSLIYKKFQLLFDRFLLLTLLGVKPPFSPDKPVRELG